MCISFSARSTRSIASSRSVFCFSVLTRAVDEGAAAGLLRLRVDGPDIGDEGCARREKDRSGVDWSLAAIGVSRNSLIAFTARKGSAFVRPVCADPRVHGAVALDRSSWISGPSVLMTVCAPASVYTCTTQLELPHGERDKRTGWCALNSRR